MVEWVGEESWGQESQGSTALVRIYAQKTEQNAKVIAAWCPGERAGKGWCAKLHTYTHSLCSCSPTLYTHTLQLPLSSSHTKQFSAL